MKKRKLLWDLLPAMILWLMLSVFLCGWIFTFLTDAKPENKLTLFADAAVTDGTGLAVQLEETLKSGPIRMVKVHPFAYAMLDGEQLRTADAYIVRASHVEEYREWFAPLPAVLAEGAAEGELLLLEGVPFGLRVYDAAAGEGILAQYIDYHDPALPQEDHYLLLGNSSLHLTANPAGADDLAVSLAEALLSLP
jgi:hypothetical protein